MALDLPSLNRKEVVDASKRSQFFPYELTGNHKEAVLGYRFNPPCKENQNRASFRGRVKILTSDNANAVGREYILNFKVGRPGEQQDYSDRDRRAFLAACMGENADASDFDADKANQTMLDSDEKGSLAGGECVIFHTRTSKKKEAAVLKNGVATKEERIYANDYFNPVG